MLVNLALPDDAGEDAAIGTVAHEVAETWLIAAVSILGEDHEENLIAEAISWAEPKDMIGEVRMVREQQRNGEYVTFEVEITEEMLAYVQQYVEFCLETPGVRYTERRVYFEKLTPIKKQGGTSDFAVCQPGILTIKDLKYGKGHQVFAACDTTDVRSMIEKYEGGLNGNPQAMLYALGFFYEFDHLYHFEKIIIQIGQPRLDHFQTWETTREELLKFAKHAKIKAFEAWSPDGSRTPGKKTCLWCKAKGDCAALLAWVKEAVEQDTDDVFEAVDDDGVIEGSFKVVTGKQMALVKAEAEEDGFTMAPPPVGKMSTAQLAKLLPMRSLIEAWFTEMFEEAQRRAIAGEEVPDHKLVDGRDGDRKWKGNEPETMSGLNFVGLPFEQQYQLKLVSPAQAEERIKASYKLKGKGAADLISHLTTRDKGKPTLVHLSDKREAKEDVGLLFDNVSDDGGL